MRAVALGGLIAGVGFAHAVMRWRAAVLGMRFDAVPFDEQNHPAEIFDTGEDLDQVRAGEVSVDQGFAEFLIYSSRLAGSTC